MTAIDLEAPAGALPLAARPLGPLFSVLALLAVVLLAVLVGGLCAFLAVSALHPEGFDGFLATVDNAAAGESAAVATVERMAWLAAVLIYILSGLGVVAVAAIRAGPEIRPLLAMNFSVPARLTAIGLVLALLYCVLATVLEQFYPSLKELITFPKDPVARGLAIVAIAICAPVVEELAFRGFLYTAIRAKWGFAVTLITTSLLFAVMHYDPTWMHALLVLPVAFLLGWAREKSGGVAVPIIIHMTVNAFGVLSLLYYAAKSAA